MVNLKEVGYIFLAIIILTFALNYKNIINNNLSFNILIFNLILMSIVIIISIIAKTIVAYYYEAKIEHKIWMWQRFGFRREHYFKKPIPMGIILPFVLSVISKGYILFLVALEFDVSTTSARAAKKHGIYRFTEMTDIHIGLIASAGIVGLLFASIIGYILNFPEFSRLCVYYSAYSLIPFGNLDGTKIFFGSRTFWIALIVLVAIFFGFSFMP